MYGDYNDLPDHCTRSTIGVGMAQPQAMPSDNYGSNHLSIAMYPDRGQDTASVVGSEVQAVERQTCESWPLVALTDCMGVATIWPFPGAVDAHRNVLNSGSGWLAPALCWYSPNWGEVLGETLSYPCDMG